MADKNKPVTHLCTSDLHNIWIRGRHLTEELVGHMSFTQMILFHLLKKDPTPMQTAIVDAVLVTIMEHGLTPSAIATRQTFLGAPESIQGAVAAGLLGVGSRFAGASDEAAQLLAEIVAEPEAGRPAMAAAIAERYRTMRKPLPGYGHPVHREGDPRVPRLEQIARDNGAQGQYLDAMHLLGTAINEATGKSLVINTNAAIGAVLLEAGLPPGIARGINLISRCAGLVGHILEEMETPSAAFMWHLVEESVPYSVD